MCNDWLTFLSSQPPHRDPAAAQLFALPHLGLIQIAGADALKFLQGQFTSDVRQVTATHSHLSGYCNPQGRLLACFRLWRCENVLYLQLPQDNLATVLQRLQLYKLRAAVVLEDISAVLPCCGIAGADAGKLLHTVLGAAPPEAINAVAQINGVTVIHLPGALPRWQLAGTAATLIAIWQQLTAHGAHAAPINDWRLLDIRAGLPNIYAANTAEFLPQMLNLQLLDGVSFQKGCYVGQEVVARLRYLGVLKRRLYRARCAGTSCPQPGDVLYSPTSASRQGAGRVLEAAHTEDGNYELLAVIENALAATVAIYFGQPGSGLELLMLPYPVVD